jgi:hypothetical protein
MGLSAGVTGNNVPWNKCPGNNRLCCNDVNLRSLVSVVMHLNPSTNIKVGHFFQGDIHYCYTGVPAENVPCSVDINPGDGGPADIDSSVWSPGTLYRVYLATVYMRGCKGLR